MLSEKWSKRMFEILFNYMPSLAGHFVLSPKEKEIVGKKRKEKQMRMREKANDSAEYTDNISKISESYCMTKLKAIRSKEL